MTDDMTIEQIKSSLARFYEGQTTPEEERALADFFRREDIPNDLQQDKQLFLLLTQTSNQEMTQDIAEEITTFVNNLGQTEIQPLIPEDKQHKGVIFRLKTPPKDKEFNVPEVETSDTRAPHLLLTQAAGFRSVRLKRFWYRIAATAAILLVIGGGVLHHQRTYTTDPFLDTCATPEEAAEAIYYANNIINRSTAPFLRSTMIATEHVNNINETFGKIQPYINQ